MVESIHAVIQEESAAEEPSWALAPAWAQSFFVAGASSGCRTEVSHRSHEL